MLNGKKIGSESATYVENGFRLNTRVEFIDSHLLACDKEKPDKVGKNSSFIALNTNFIMYSLFDYG